MKMIFSQDNERTEMLNHFRSLSLEASVLENNNHSLETEAAEARCALQSAQDQIADLERRLSDKDCLVHGYESQVRFHSSLVHVTRLSASCRSLVQPRSSRMSFSFTRRAVVWPVHDFSD